MSNSSTIKHPIIINSLFDTTQIDSFQFVKTKNKLTELYNLENIQ